MDEIAYGGIVFNNAGEVLMRSPSGFWGGYVWTFAKGGKDPQDQSPEYTALREVREETGYVCEVIAPIPGAFESDTCVTKYFLLRPTGRVHNYDHETQEVRWVSKAEAFELISLTRTEKGRLRDTNALKSAIEVLQSF
ncbi:NUDIX hydrolase [Paenibacillus sp. LHD-38]|uniref:NUDIX hydrolase n=1 Tax=Paenibacillus sp. LHD-38 TaxID=3072143 RepID=UPI00280E3544|nr:NUDIX hydrolase [Paenibacillus sp. LHD-38]MDQ8732893.1 NUDIX hydrolase [Paenibacillus sp. LHD-38]